MNYSDRTIHAARELVTRLDVDRAEVPEAVKIIADAKTAFEVNNERLVAMGLMPLPYFGGLLTMQSS